MTGTSQKTEGTATIWVVAITGALLAAVALPVAGGREAVGTGVGAALAVANLWAIGLLVRRMFSETAPAVPWALVAVGKIGGLFGAVYLLVFFEVADILPIVVGYGALPIGIVVAQLGSKPPADQQPPADRPPADHQPS